MVSAQAEQLIENVVVEEQDANIEFQEIRNELNTFLIPFSKSFKRKLIGDVKELRVKIDGHLNSDEKCQLNLQVVKLISKLIHEFFTNLEYQLDVDDFCGQATFSNETKEYLLKLIEKYVSTVYYRQLFQLVEIESFENDGDKLEEMIEKFHWISAAHLELNLNEENEDVRIFMYSAIRSLLLITSVKSPHQKLHCISQFCKFVMGALSECKDEEPGQSISADDFLPLLIYTFLKAKVPQVIAHVSFISYFIGLRRVLESGETAYYFTTFNAALDFIQRLDDSNISNSSGHTPRFFNNSVNVIHDEVRSMNQNRRRDVLQSLKDKITQSQKLVATQMSDLKEKKCWNVIKWIPLVNVGYGGIRSICYTCKGNRAEALNSVAGVTGGLVGIGTGLAAATIGGPIIIPIVAGLVCSGSANQAVTGGGELMVEAHGNPDLFKTLSSDGKEKKIYVKMIKDAPLLGMIYSSVRSTVYYAKGNKKEGKASAVNSAVNTAASAAGIIAGVGMAKLSSHLTNMASAAADASDDIIKPMSTEIIEFITSQAARVSASSGANVMAHVGANALSRAIIEESISNDKNDCLF